MDFTVCGYDHGIVSICPGLSVDVNSSCHDTVYYSCCFRQLFRFILSLYSYDILYLYFSYLHVVLTLEFHIVCSLI